MSETDVVGVGEPLEIEDGQAFTVVHPVEGDGKFLVVHPVTGKGHLNGLGQGVLSQVSFPGLLVHLQDDVVGAQGVEDRPVVAVLDGVIGSIVSPPAFHAQQITPFVKVPAKVLAARRGVGHQQLSLEQRPFGRRDRTVQTYRGRWGGLEPKRSGRRERDGDRGEGYDSKTSGRPATTHRMVSERTIGGHIVSMRDAVGEPAVVAVNPVTGPVPTRSFSVPAPGG